MKRGVILKKSTINIYPGLRAKMSFYGHDIQKLAETLKISNDSVRRRLKGNVEFELTEIKKLMKEYNCTFDELFNSEPNYKN